MLSNQQDSVVNIEEGIKALADKYELIQELQQQETTINIENQFSEIIKKILSTPTTGIQINELLISIFQTNEINENQVKMIERYLMVAYHLYSRDELPSFFQLILIEHIPTFLFIYFTTKPLLSKLSKLQKIFISVIESILILIYHTESIYRKELPEKDKTFKFILTSTQGLNIPFLEESKNIPSSSIPNITMSSSSTSLDDYNYEYSKSFRPNLIRSELDKNQESLSPLYIKDFEQILPITSEVNQTVLVIVCQVFHRRIKEISLESKLNFVRVINRLVTQKIPFRIPTIDDVEIIKQQNEEAKKIMEESLKIIREDNVNENLTEVSEKDIEIELKRKKKFFYHEQLTQLDLLLLYLEEIGDELDVGVKKDGKKDLLSKARILLPLPIVDELIPILQHCCMNLENYQNVPVSNQSTLMKDLFLVSKNDLDFKKMIESTLLETLYALYMRVNYDYLDSIAIVRIRNLLSAMK
ncbi:hypothetical protein ABK040_015614 [Willaertia magna]